MLRSMPESGGSTGLDQYHQSSPTPEPDFGRARPACNLYGMQFVNLDSGVVVWARCNRLMCDYCVRLNAFRRAAAIAWAKPERALTVTLLAGPGEEDPWPVCRRRWNKIREYLKRAGVDHGSAFKRSSNSGRNDLATATSAPEVSIAVKPPPTLMVSSRTCRTLSAAER